MKSIVRCTSKATESPVMLFDQFPIFIPVSGVKALVILYHRLKAAIGEAFWINARHRLTYE